MMETELTNQRNYLYNYILINKYIGLIISQILSGRFVYQVDLFISQILSGRFVYQVDLFLR